MTKVKPWYNEFGGRYTGNQPYFYDAEKLVWTKVLEENWTIIRDEITALKNSHPERLKPYYINKSMSFPPKSWKTMGLFFWMFTMHGNCRKCPKTVEILDRIPGLISCSLSILEAGANINPHQGDTDAVIRCHLGLVIPGELPKVGFQVGDEIRKWEEGKTLPFCDAQTHTAWNHSDEQRLILIIDVLRPEFIKNKYSVSAHVLASSVIQMLYQRYPGLGLKSGYLKKIIYTISLACIRAILPLQRLSLRKLFSFR